jgi:hypothetical protein
MEKLTYKQAFDKITEAYIKGEIQPYDSTFCFCGTLSTSKCWNQPEYCNYDELEYRKDQYINMEMALLTALGNTPSGRGEFYWRGDGDGANSEPSTEYENKLFAGMCAALEVLKQIHIERGEIIDETPAFTKRQLA